MEQDSRRDKGIRFVGCCELVSATTADTTAMRAEFLRRRKQTAGPVEWHFVQPKLTLFWFRDNFKRLKAKMDGRGRDAPREGQGPPPQYENAAGRSCRCLRLRRPKPSHEDICSRDRQHAGGVAARAKHRPRAVRHVLTGSHGRSCFKGRIVQRRQERSLGRHRKSWVQLVSRHPE